MDMKSYAEDEFTLNLWQIDRSSWLNVFFEIGWTSTFHQMELVTLPITNNCFVKQKPHKQMAAIPSCKQFYVHGTSW